MKIFFYIPSLMAGGAEKQCSLIAAALRTNFGHDVTVVIDRLHAVKDSNREILDRAGVSLMGLPSGRLRAFCKLVKMFRADRSAVVFSFLTRPNFVGGLAARLAGLRSFYGGIRCTWFPWWKYALEILSNRFLSKGTIMNSHRAYELFAGHGLRKDKCRVISNVFNQPPLVLQERATDCPVIVTVGRFTAEKDYYTWLRVIRRVLESGIRVRASVEGYGRGEGLFRRWVSELGLEDVVSIYPGDFSVNELLGMGDVYLSTSTSEGVSNAILEAMNAGLPVVATDVGDNAIMVENGFSGFLAPVGAVDALAAQMIELLNDPTRRKTFGERARKILREKYSEDRVASLYEKLIREDMSMGLGGESCCA